MRQKLIQISGLALTAAYALAIVWLYATEPRSFREVATGAQVASGTYQVDQAKFEAALALFRREQFRAAREEWQQADPAQSDATTQFYIAYSFYREGWGRVYYDQDLFKQGLAAVNRAIALAPKFGARRAVLLPVSAPFHCVLMQPAADVMSEALSNVTVSAPSVPLVANVLASAISDPDAIRARLVEQVTGMVRWRESMLYLRSQGVDTLYEVGAGRVLTGLARRFEGFEARSIGTPEELEAAATSLQS